MAGLSDADVGQAVDAIMEEVEEAMHPNMMEIEEAIDFVNTLISQLKERLALLEEDR